MKRFLKILAAVLLVLILLMIYAQREATLHPKRMTDVMQGYMSVVEDFTRLAKDPEAGGVAAALHAKQLFDGADAEAIVFFEQLLPETRSLTVRRAVQAQLVDLYHSTGQQEKARAISRALIVGAADQIAPAGGSASVNFVPAGPPAPVEASPAK